jgi:hypothetical protein
MVVNGTNRGLQFVLHTEAFCEGTILARYRAIEGGNFHLHCVCFSLKARIQIVIPDYI